MEKEVPPLYEKKQECLNCKKTFNTLKVRTKSIKIDHTESDFQPIYAEGSVYAYYYNVYVCEHCGFAFTEDFTKYFAPGVHETIDEQITKRWLTHSFGSERTIFQAIQAYKLALLSGSLKKEKFITLAGLALRLAWLYRSLKNDGQEQRFLKMARDYYMDSFSTEDYNGTQMSMLRVLYMVAEISRRVGDLENATRYFSKVIENQNVGGDAKVVEMAKDQWTQIRAARETGEKSE